MLFAALEIIFRQRWRYLALFVLLPLAAAVVCVQLYPKATVAESLWIGDQTYLNTQAPQYQQYLTPAQITLTDMTQYFQTRQFADRVIERLKSEQAFASQSEAASTGGGLGSSLLATASGANVVTITCTSPRAALGVAILNAALQVFEHHEAAALASQQTVSAQVYSKQLADAQAALSQAQAALAAYQAAHPQENAVQQANDPQLTVLNQSVADHRSAVSAAQTKLTGVTSSSQAAQLENASLYQLIDPPYRTSGRLSSLPKKQMLMAAAVCWGLGLILLGITLRLQRVILHPAQLERIVGFPPVAITAPLTWGRSIPSDRLLGEGGSR